MFDATEAIGLGLGAVSAAGLAAGGCAYAAMWPGSRLFGGALVAPRRPDEIALTFDDGPNPRWTPLLLEALARHRVRATFFMVGKYAALQKPLVRQIHALGHSIGNHTWTHPNLALTGSRRTREELLRTNGELEQMLGARIHFFRPPFGGRRPVTLRIARELGMTPVLWNAMTADWNATTPEQITGPIAGQVDRQKRLGYAGNIVLHDGSHLTLDADRSATVAAAEKLVESFSISCRFVTLDEWGTGI